MGVNATLAGHRALKARAEIPSWGFWFADVKIDGEVTLAGAVSLTIADLTLHGSVIAGGPAKGHSYFTIVAGAGGWAKPLPKKSYANDAGVKLSTIIIDAARAVGEKIDEKTLPDTRVGPAWTRPEGQPAARLLEQLAPRGWYVGEDGVTRFGKRAALKLPSGVTHGPVDLSRGTVTLASDTIASILPGLVVDGLAVVDVMHEIGDKGLRSTVWGKRAAGLPRELAALAALFDQLDPNRKFRGVYEYRVVTLAGKRLNLQPVRSSTGMPDLQRVPVRPGVSGSESTLVPGSRVVVGFIDADGARPFVFGLEDADGSGFKPVTTHIDATATVKLADGARPMPATGDLAGGIWPIVGTTRVLG